MYAVHMDRAHIHSRAQQRARRVSCLLRVSAPSVFGVSAPSRAAFCEFHVQTMQSPHIPFLMRKRSLVLTIKTRLKVYT